MKPNVLILFLLFLLSCDVVQPTLMTGPMAPDISSEIFMNASVSVLQEYGYTVIIADKETGVVTTDWRAESSFVSQSIFGYSHRTRVSVVIDFHTKELKIQITKQKKEKDHPWRNDGLSKDNREQMKSILSKIQIRAGEILSQKVESAGTS